MRYTSLSAEHPTLSMGKSHIPLLDRHIHRLREAHAHFSRRDGTSVWDEWVGDDELWRILKARLEEVEHELQRDWRVSTHLLASGKLTHVSRSGFWSTLERRSRFRSSLRRRMQDHSSSFLQSDFPVHVDRSFWIQQSRTSVPKSRPRMTIGCTRR